MASYSYTPRTRKRNPPKRKMVRLLHEEPEHLLMERPKKRRRTQTKEKNVKRQKTGTHTEKRNNSLQKAGPLSTENQSEPSCSYSLRARKENPLKRKRMDLLHEDSEPQLKEMPEKRRRTETEEKNVMKEKGHAKRKKTGTRPVKSDILQTGSLSTETQSEPSCSSTLSIIKDLIYGQSELQPEDMPEDFSRRYTIGKWLGSGGYASVYAGVRTLDGEKVAVKYVLKEDAEYFTLPSDTRSIPLEAVLMELCKTHRSPYVIKILEWFETPKGFLLIMERPRKYITLSEFCRHLQGRMSEVLARIIMWKVVQAAIHCKRNGVLHRDIKEDNILLNPETLELKLIDFGYAYLLKDKPYKAFGGPPISLPTRWIVKNTCSEPATVWDLGDLLCTLTYGEKPSYCYIPLVIHGLSEACLSLINWCLEEDIKKRPNFEQILQHDWFQDMIILTQTKNGENPR